MCSASWQTLVFRSMCLPSKREIQAEERFNSASSFRNTGRDSCTVLIYSKRFSISAGPVGLKHLGRDRRDRCHRGYMPSLFVVP